MKQPQSAVGQHVFRELSGPEAAQVFAHDLEQAIIDMLATDEFKQKAIECFEKSGRFGSGKCFPVVFMRANMVIKVFASVESARSKEKMPAPFAVDVNLQAGEMKPDTEEITEAEVTISRVAGLSVENAVDKVRLETGLVPLVPTRNPDGMIVNAPGKHSERALDYEARFAKSKATVLRKKAEQEALLLSEAERERVLQENEAREMEPASAPESGIK